MHIHIEKDDCSAKFNLEPLELVKSKKFTSKELKEIRILVEEYTQLFKSRWNEFFNYQ